MNLLAGVRIGIGCLFIISGLGKLLEPYQNFLYVVQSYNFLPMWAEDFAARLVPWLEFFLGVFLGMGLWLEWTLKVSLALTTAFIGILSQAIIRALPIYKCGCFGEFLSIPLPFMILIDSSLWLLMVFLLFRLPQTAVFSLDQRCSS